MISYYTAFVSNITARDTALLQIAIMAAAVVIPWFVINSRRVIPWPRLQRLLRTGYLAGGVIMYALTYFVLKTGGA